MKKLFRLLVVPMLCTTLLSMTACHTTYITKGNRGLDGKEGTSSKRIKGNGNAIIQSRTVQGTFEK